MAAATVSPIVDAMSKKFISHWLGSGSPVLALLRAVINCFVNQLVNQRLTQFSEVHWVSWGGAVFALYFKQVDAESWYKDRSRGKSPYLSDSKRIA